MKCCNESRSETSAEIDAQLRGQLRDEFYHIRILMLGTSASGKTTIAKQLKILFKNGFTRDELENYKQILMLNIFNGLKELIFQVEQNKQKVLKSNRKIAKYFVDLNSYVEILTPENAEMAKKLWNDKNIQKIWKNRNSIDFPINLEYMIKNIDRFTEENYVPTNKDVLFARQRTTGVVETTFNNGKYKWTLVDIGGQRSERRKWIHFFDSTYAIIYCAGLDEYDMVVPEDPSKNKMLESMEVFEDTVNEHWCQNKTLIVFLNKTDLLRRKIKTSPLNEFFPEYKGYSYDHALHFIKKLLLRRVKNRNVEDIYVHATCAIKTDDIDYVFKIVSESIINERLKRSGVF